MSESMNAQLALPRSSRDPHDGEQEPRVRVRSPVEAGHHWTGTSNSTRSSWSDRISRQERFQLASAKCLRLPSVYESSSKASPSLSSRSISN
jgi:hypothetical protein